MIFHTFNIIISKINTRKHNLKSKIIFVNIIYNNIYNIYLFYKYLKIMYISNLLEIIKYNVMYTIFVFFILKINVHCNFKRETMKIFN